MPAQSVSRLLTGLASLRLTLAVIPLLIAAILLSYRFEQIASDWVALILAIMALNLLAALLKRPQFRRQSGLLIFHVCLLIIVVLAGMTILTRLQARVELVEGQAFDASQVMIDSQGWWLFDELESVAFTQGPVEVQFHPGLRRGATHSEIILPETTTQRVMIGDTQPLRLQGYRFVTTSNKGYAVLLNWTDENGTLAGAMHMPSFPLQEWNQTNQWTTPTGESVQLELQLPPLQSERDWILSSAGHSAPLKLTLSDDQTHVLHAGDVALLSSGQLQYAGLRLWMGYQIDYNPLLPWMFAAALIGIAGLGWHFWGKYGQQPVKAPRPAISIGLGKT